MGPLSEGLSLFLHQGKLLYDSWMQDGLPLQDFVASARHNSLVTAKVITTQAIQEIEAYHEEHIMDLTTDPQTIMESVLDRIKTIQRKLESMAHSFSTQADGLATRFPTLFRRLHTKCARDPSKKD